MKRYKTVDEFIDNSGDWKSALKELRKIMQGTEMEETVKWGMPVYTVGGKNVTGLGSFKSYVGIWFYQGGLMKDAKKKMMNAQEGKTKAMRQWRFDSLAEIKKEKANIKAYLKEAIANQKAGKEIKPARKKPLVIPPELVAALSSNVSLKKKFEAMNLTNRRDFAEYISTAKREATKQSRLEKIIPMIKRGEGLNDRYKK